MKLLCTSRTPILVVLPLIAGCASSQSPPQTAEGVDVQPETLRSQTSNEPRQSAQEATDHSPDTASVTSVEADAPAAEASEAEATPVETIEGRATYYASSFAGKVTKSGEPYEPSELTAATKANGPPIGSVVRVVRKDTDAAVTVRVNDRLPQRMGATIDLSRAAAERLDMIEAGIVPVRVEVLSLPESEQ